MKTRHILAQFACGALVACGGNSAGEADESSLGEPTSPFVVECRQGSFPDITNWTEKNELVGSNGTFVDQCENGNLVDYSCEIMSYGSGESAYAAATGIVLGAQVDCEGRCRDGVCPNICPYRTEVLRYEAVTREGIHTLVRQNGGRFECRYLPDRSPRDCSVIEPGVELRVTNSPSSCPSLANTELILIDPESGEQQCVYEGCEAIAP